MKGSTFIAALCITCLAPPARCEQPSRDAGAVNVTITRQRKMMVETWVNGLKGNFLVDTGAGNTYLGERFAVALRLARDEGGYSYNVRGAMRFDVVDVNSLELGSNRVPMRHRLLHVTNLNWATKDVGSSLSRSGIIGADILMNNGVMIDCAASRIWFGSMAARVSFPKRAVSFVRRQGDEIAVSARVNGVEGLFIVDTGYNVSIVSPEFAGRQKTAGPGRSKSRILRITSLELGPKHLSARLSQMTMTSGLGTVNQGYIEQGEEPYDGILGMDFLIGNRVVIDCRQRVLRFD